MQDIKAARCKMEAKIVNAINFIRLKNKKGASQLDCQKFSNIICDVEIDGKIYKNGSDKNASFFVKNCISLEAVSLVKNSDLTVNNTHSQF